MAQNNRLIRANPYQSYSITFLAGTADRSFFFKTSKPMAFESLQYAADNVDSTDKFKVTFSVKDPQGTTRAYVTGTDVTTADTPNLITTLDSTALPGGFIPAGSTLILLVDFSGTAANVVGGSVLLELSVAH